jgi:hypothetical protein
MEVIMKSMVKILFLTSISLTFVDASLKAANKRTRSHSDPEENFDITSVKAAVPGFNSDLSDARAKRAEFHMLVTQAVAALESNWRNLFTGDNALHVILDHQRSREVIRHLKSFYPQLINACIDTPNNAGLTPRYKAFGAGTGPYDLHMNS